MCRLHPDKVLQKSAHVVDLIGSMQHVVVAGACSNAICLAYSKTTCHAQPHVMLSIHLQVSAKVLGLVMTAEGKRRILGIKTQQARLMSISGQLNIMS